MAVNQIKAGALLSYLSLGLTNLIGILYTPFMLRMLGQSEYGMFSLAASVVGYLTILDMGFGNAIIRYTAKFKAEKLAEKQWSLFGMFIILYSVIGVLTLAVGAGLYFNIDSLFHRTMTSQEIGQMRIMVILLVLNLAVSFPFGIFSSIISAYQHFVWQQAINIVRIILQPCVMIVILLMGYKAVAMVVVMTVLNFVVLAINCWFCFTKLHIRVRFHGFDTPLLKEICGYSFFIFIGSIIDKLYWSTGQFVLGVFVGTSAVAVYSLAIQLKSYYMNFANALSSVFLPKVTSMVADNSSNSEFSDLFIRVGRIQFAILSFIISGFIIFGRSFIKCWAGSDYSESYSIALIFMIPLTIPLIQTMGVTILQAKAELKFRAYTYLAIALTSLVFSIPMTRLYGGMGCAVTTSVCLLLGNGFVMNIYYWKKIKLDVVRFWKEILRMIWPVLWIPFLCLYLLTIWNTDSWGRLGIGILLFSIVYLTIFWRFSLNESERLLLVGPISRIRKKIFKI